MRSSVFKLTAVGGDLTAILDEVEKFAVYNELTQKQTLQLRLLTEELMGLLKSLPQIYDGDFWFEKENNGYALHVEADTFHVSDKTAEALLSVSKTGKNSVQVGIMGKIRKFIEKSVLNVDIPADDNSYVGEVSLIMYDKAWSLSQYKTSVMSVEEDEAKDELEKSIIASLATDVLVGIKGTKINVVVKKVF